MRYNTARVKVESGTNVNHSVTVGPETTLNIERRNYQLQVSKTFDRVLINNIAKLIVNMFAFGK